MAWKFFSIGKANAEIERLEGELVNHKEISEHAEKLSKDNSDLTAKIASLESDLSTAKASITSISAELATAKASATEFDVKVKTEAEKLASAKALEITASQGQAPIILPPSTATLGKKDFSNLKGFARAVAANVEMHR